MLLQNLRWADLKTLSGRVFVVPLGSLEQHGPHMPLFTDSLIISHVAERVEALRSDSIVMLPVQWLGHSPHHRRFGSVSLDMRPYMELIEGVCRSLIGIGARKVFLMNGHGGNDIPCKAALRELKSEFEEMRDLYIAYAAYWHLAKPRFNQIRESPIGGMGHACEMETSILLRTNPQLVQMDKAERGGPGPHMGCEWNDMLQPPPFFLMNEFDEMSHNGVIGMPEYANADKGEQFLAAAAEASVAFIDQLSKWTFQERPPTKP